MEETNAELESFRQQWKAEVSSRARAENSNKESQSSTSRSSKTTRRPPTAPRIPTDKESSDQEAIEPQNSHDIRSSTTLGGTELGESSTGGSREPQSALEHYERAVEREAQGSLGDSVDLYRKAFKLDQRVDLKYKNKHFPPSYFASKPSNPNPSNAPVTVPNTAHHSLDGPPQTITELIASFSGLAIEPAPPAIQGTPALPCPIAGLPDEILVHIFRELAIIDLSSFVRLACVCKNIAYLVATEEQIWRRVCEGSEVGFGAMHYQWQREVLGGPLEEDFLELKDRKEIFESESPAAPSKEAITESLLQGVYTSWLQMFRLRPRVRFNGCYISTNNYIRPGQASVSQVSWHSPVHIVTYYRYLRFFRDGTLISLLTTDEPINVVHHLTKELMETHRNNAHSYLPSAVMQNALRGRWRLSPAYEHPDLNLKDAEGDLCIETEGVRLKYIYRMDLSLRSSGKGAKNNKLAWAGFWCYNKLNDDWSEFPRRNEKPLIWSRVRSYGDGA